MIRDLKPEQYPPITAAYKKFFKKFEAEPDWLKPGTFDIVTGNKPHDAFIHYAFLQYGFKLASKTTQPGVLSIDILDEKKYMMFLLQWV